ncbi:twin-arginine translocase TatA/TatE family subunit [Microlunatus flavus]|uniref:Sec-independent protein translocase protein TatA n=1 Tax=Microlunatus flavus TaxID=1036181 RepID=A0A1H9MS15_9ACTN|nr:sec-independent protein translocase protein TatA [Microlunatus flavus]
MTPLAFGGLGVPELLIILAVVLLLFGGARLAGLGKSTGRALREFKEETKGLRDKDGAAVDEASAQRTSEPYTAEPLAPTDPGYTQPPRSQAPVDPTGDVRRDV